MYTNFAMVYDELMDDIPYDQWIAYIQTLLQEQGITKGQVIADLGCGTGKVTRGLAACGYRMLGIDISQDMLMIARDKQMQAYYASGEEKDFARESVTDDDHILYIEQDMTKLTLNGEVDAMISVCDSMNYLTEDTDLLQAFTHIHEYLSKDGVFLFDMKTPYLYRELLGDQTFAENREDVSYIWENYFDEESQIHEYALSLFVPEQKVEDETQEDLGSYHRFQEFHYQRAYSVEEVCNLAKQAGFKVKAIYDAFTHECAREDSERLYFVLIP